MRRGAGRLSWIAGLLSVTRASPPFGMAAGRALGASETIDATAILDDPQAPVGGNPKGSIPIVAFFDYNCPYCRATAPDLRRFVANDRYDVVHAHYGLIGRSSRSRRSMARGSRSAPIFKANTRPRMTR